MKPGSIDCIFSGFSQADVFMCTLISFFVVSVEF